MKYRIILGECLEEMMKLPDCSVDMVFCDLPYGKTANGWDIIIPLKELWTQYSRIVKSGGVIVLTGIQPFSSQLVVSNLSGFKCEHIWEKNQATGHLNANKKPMRAHEQVLVFVNGKSVTVYNPQKTSGHTRKVSTAAHKRNSKLTPNYRNHGASSYDSTDRYPRSVIKLPTDKQKSSIHPTQKPVSLVEYFVKTYSNEGDTVLDNCAGSFTTAIACMNTNRDFIGIEMNEIYFNAGKERIENHLNGK